jgi:hypothetical protein
MYNVKCLLFVMCSVLEDHVFRDYVISNVRVQLLSVSQILCVSSHLSHVIYTCHSFFMGYVLISIMCHSYIKYVSCQQRKEST